VSRSDDIQITLVDTPSAVAATGAVIAPDMVGEPTTPAIAGVPGASTLASGPSIRIDVADGGQGDGRFDRFRLIRWWDQEKLAAAKVLVVGAGALGNEILKNLALLGVGNVLVVDLDTVENSNLSRSVLYRVKDNGTPKAVAAARAAKDIYPDLKAHGLVANAVYDLGLGVYRWADVVMGGLDNREARLSINRGCQKLGKTWIDGAIEQIQGTARVFAPDGPCYECTMSDADWRLLAMRRSCNLLSRAEMAGGKTPTTPTISSIVAGVQSQEAVKLLHGLPTIAGKGWVFDGFGTDAYTVEFQRKDDCLSHDPLDAVVEVDAGAADVTLGDLLAEARRHLGPGAELELARDVLHKLVCPSCRREEEMFVSLGKVSAEAAWCPACRRDGKDVRREVVTFYKVRGDESFLDRSAAAVGVPPFDVLIARNNRDPAMRGRAIGLELSWDAENVLGPLWTGGALDWA
jgi:molybdopterin/thiamine biosynthesis adenylyltransferase